MYGGTLSRHSWILSRYVAYNTRFSFFFVSIFRKTCQACKCPRETHSIYQEQVTSVRERLGLKPTNSSKMDADQLGYTWTPPGIVTPSKVSFIHNTSLWFSFSLSLSPLLRTNFNWIFSLSPPFSLSRSSVRFNVISNRCPKRKYRNQIRWANGIVRNRFPINYRNRIWHWTIANTSSHSIMRRMRIFWRPEMNLRWTLDMWPMQRSHPPNALNVMAKFIRVIWLWLHQSSGTK